MGGPTVTVTGARYALSLPKENIWRENCCEKSRGQECCGLLGRHTCTLRQVHPFCEYYPVLGTTRAGYPTSGRGPVPNLKSGSGEQIGAPVRQLPGAQLTGPMRGRAIACHSANLTI